MALPGSLQIDWSFPGCALHPAATLTALIRSVPEIWEGLGLVGMTILLCGSWGGGGVRDRCGGVLYVRNQET